MFDLLGDIYTMPAAGGEAQCLQSGLALDIQPRFSPDGKQISFTSDRAGGDNIWVMNAADGSNPKQITKENFRLLNNAIWTPDGNYLIARKHFTSGRSLGAGEFWKYHTAGNTTGTQLTTRKNDQQDVNEPTISPDGRYLYYAEDVYSGGFFQYNKDPNSQIYAIKRLDLLKNETKTIISGAGGASRPQLSRDGKLLAFVRRVRTQTVLYIHNLESGEQYPIYAQLSKDQQEAWCLFGTYSNFSWMPDNQSIVFWAKGKIWNINIKDFKVVEIPFSVKSKHTIAEALHYDQKVDVEQITVKVIRHCVTSPDEKYIVFSALGHLWKKELPNQTPTRLTNNETNFEFEPAFSPDGKSLVFVSWNDEASGAIQKIDLTTRKITQISRKKGIYRTPRFSPDGQLIVYQKEGGNDAQGFDFCNDAGIYYTKATSSSEPILLTEEGEQAQFMPDSKGIYFQTYEGMNKALKSISLDKTLTKTYFTSKYTNAFVPSPDGKYIAFRELWKVYVAAFPTANKPIDLNANSTDFPVAQIARDAGSNIHWSKDSKIVHFTLGEQYFTAQLTNRFKFLSQKDSLPPLDTVGIKINLMAKTDKPKGSVLFKNARIITVNSSNEVLENSDLLVQDNKIIAIGKNISSPADATVIDCTNKTLMPGIVDVHAHLWTFREGISPQKQWTYFANLAYGVTTTHDPSSNSEMVFSQAEMVKTGSMLGPRIYSTGTILYGADGDFKATINSLDDARSALRRTQALGAFSVKSYNQPRRDQRQQVIHAARELNMMVVPEGGSTTWHNLTQILDGHTGIEHNIPIAPLYNDFIQLWKNSKTGYNPTLIVAYGAVNGEYYWFQKTNVWEKSRLMNFTPRTIIDSRSRHRTMIPDEEYENGHILVSKSCKKLADEGVKVNLGAHGQLNGLGAHWELWMLQQGGMTNLQAIQAATINGAYYIGMDKEIGSLEQGKLADILVLEKNPLDDIQNTETIQYTMANGRVFDSQTMNQIGNYKQNRTKFYWELPSYNANFPYHEQQNSFFLNQCGCRH